MRKKPAFQDPHSLVESRDGDLEAAIGRQVRALRKKLDMRVTELAKLAQGAGVLRRQRGRVQPVELTAK